MATVQVPSVWPPGSRVSITGGVVSGDSHVVGGVQGGLFGTPIFRENLRVTPPGLLSAQQFGALHFIFARQTVVVPGLGTAQQFGTALRTNQIVHVQGFVPYPAFVPSITGQVISGDGHVVGGFGGPGYLFGKVTIHATYRLPVGGVSSAQQFGVVKTAHIVHPPGLESAQQFGTRIGIVFRILGLDTAQLFGAPDVFIVWVRPLPCDDLDLAVSDCIDLDLDVLVPT